VRMETWVVVCVSVVAIAMVFQAAVLAVMFFQMRQTLAKFDHLLTDLHARSLPILTRTQIFLDDAQPKVSELIADAAHVVYLARGQAQKMDRVLTDASDRLRGQVVHADRIVTGALETVEEAGTQFRQTMWRPIQKASAVLTGLKVGLDFLKSRGRQQRNDEGVEREEELFI
jgi:hypothetical protein